MSRVPVLALDYRSEMLPIQQAANRFTSNPTAENRDALRAALDAIADAQPVNYSNRLLAGEREDMAVAERADAAPQAEPAAEAPAERTFSADDEAEDDDDAGDDPAA